MPRRESPVSIRKLQCFVACAFGKTDVDNVFALLHSVLLPDGVVLNRVDKTVHNKNVDVKIMEMIQGSDFCICDLTYARPSAYFEAGFAEGRGTPVIYICRDDHRPPSLEPHKIHFDVQMRNIVWWSESAIDSFLKEVKKRVSHIAKPIRDRLKREQEKMEEKVAFSKLSLIERLSKLVDEGRLALQQSSIWKPRLLRRVSQDPAASDDATRLWNNRGSASRMRLYSIRKSDAVTNHVSLIASDNVEKDLLISSSRLLWNNYSLVLNNPLAQFNNLIVIHLCLRRLSPQSVHRKYSLLEGLSEGVYRIPKYSGPQGTFWRVFVIVIDSVSSGNEARQRIIDALKSLHGYLEDTNL